MKKQKTQMIILLVVLVLCILGYWGAKQLPEEEQTQVQPIDMELIEDVIEESTEE